MIKVSRSQKLAVVFLTISAALHFVGSAIGAPSQLALFMAIVGLLYLCLAWLMWRGSRAISYVVFLFMLIGGIGSWIASGSPQPAPQWIFQSIAVADICCAACLFMTLWQAPISSADLVGR